MMSLSLSGFPAFPLQSSVCLEALVRATSHGFQLRSRQLAEGALGAIATGKTPSIVTAIVTAEALVRSEFD